MKNEKSAENAAKKNTMTDEQTEMLLDQLIKNRKSKKQSNSRLDLISFIRLKITRTRLLMM